ncbi:MAG: tryptophan-rich sensory protein [Clostridia bacterium]|nr:tryptophan-rich sensory protein [Clostridia bacterium]
MSFFLKTVHLKRLLLYVGGTLLGAVLSSLLANPDYSNLIKPPLTPPPWVFPVVWTILYTLMGYAAYRIAGSGEHGTREAVKLYWLQLFVNLLWPIAFFRLEWRLFAFFWLLLLVVLITCTIRRFQPIDATASRLLYPYLAWCGFATYLNLAFYLLNR